MGAAPARTLERAARRVFASMNNHRSGQATINGRMLKELLAMGETESPPPDERKDGPSYRPVPVDGPSPVLLAGQPRDPLDPARLHDQPPDWLAAPPGTRRMRS